MSERTEPRYCTRCNEPESLCTCVALREMHVEAHPGEPFKAHVIYGGELVKQFASTFVEWFRANGGESFVTVDLTDPETNQRYTLTMQRHAGGKTPASRIGELEAVLAKCREIMECNDPLNARDLFGAADQQTEDRKP